MNKKNKKYVVRLMARERRELEPMVKKGKTAAYKTKHANILLAVPAWSDARITQAFSCHPVQVENMRRRFMLEGLAAALERKNQLRPSRQRTLDGKGEDRMIALACSQPPKGCNRWTMKLLADKLVLLEIVDATSDQNVRRTLKKTNFNLTWSNVG